MSRFRLSFPQVSLIFACTFALFFHWACTESVQVNFKGTWAVDDGEFLGKLIIEEEKYRFITDDMNAVPENTKILSGQGKCSASGLKAILEDVHVIQGDRDDGPMPLIITGDRDDGPMPLKVKGKLDSAKYSGVELVFQKQ